VCLGALADFMVFEGDLDRNRGARGRRVDPESPAKLAHSLSHASNAHSEFGLAVHLTHSLGRNSGAPVRYFDLHAACRLDKADGRSRTSGVAMHVRQTLLHRAEQNQLQLAGQPVQIARQVEVHSNLASLGKTFHIPLQG